MVVRTLKMFGVAGDYETTEKKKKQPRVDQRRRHVLDSQGKFDSREIMSVLVYIMCRKGSRKSERERDVFTEGLSFVCACPLSLTLFFEGEERKRTSQFVRVTWRLSSERTTSKRIMSSELFAEGDRTNRVTVPLMRNTSWRKLRANITPSYYHYIQEFQRDGASARRHPIMMSPQMPRTASDSSKVDISHSTSPSSLFSDIEEFRPMLDLVSPSTFFHPSIVIIEEMPEEHRSNLSLPQSIEELCSLIRALLERDLTEENINVLQIEMIRRLAILLTYLAVPGDQPRETMERMTSIDAGDFPLETQTDIEEKTTSVTLHLPGRRSLYALSDTWIDHLRHQRRYASSSPRLASRSEPMIGSLPFDDQRRRWTPERFPCLIELASSNTCLEASSEFLPDFFIHPKHDQNPTEQFHATETISSTSTDFSRHNSAADQWQLPIFARRTSSSDGLYEKQRAILRLQHSSRQCYSTDRLDLVGKRVRVRAS